MGRDKAPGGRSKERRRGSREARIRRLNPLTTGLAAVMQSASAPALSRPVAAVRLRQCPQHVRAYVRATARLHVCAHTRAVVRMLDCVCMRARACRATMRVSVPVSPAPHAPQHSRAARGRRGVTSAA